ncbi:glycosyltransferase family 2 protein [Aquirufa ecclesiirivi]|uniref:glycosyltransferase family 2 protein n=1 Tax=Aquirufa ecclesiirivi TaxID=2715124 RepID=UPI003BB012F9
MDFSHLNHQLYGNPQTAKQPKVSVCLITYKHENYIRTCLDNILNQKTDFDFEIIIGEDHSPDQTASIIQTYADRFPDKIKAYIRPENVGAKVNFLHCFFDCQGEYIVHIEGDDYWTSTDKLQKQVDFLDSHPEASACFHNAQIIYEDGTGREPSLINPLDQAPWIQSTDLLKEREAWFMATASVMMRKKLVKTLPDWFFHSKSGDIPLYVILAEEGPIAYLPETMSVYRKNEGGMSYTDSNKSAAFIYNRIFMYSKINEYTHAKYQDLIKPILFEYHLLLIGITENEHSFLKRCFYLWKASAHSPQKLQLEDWKRLFKEHVFTPESLLAYLNFRKKMNRFFGIRP